MSDLPHTKLWHFTYTWHLCIRFFLNMFMYMYVCLLFGFLLTQILQVWVCFWCSMAVPRLNWAYLFSVVCPNEQPMYIAASEPQKYSQGNINHCLVSLFWCATSYKLYVERYITLKIAICWFNDRGPEVSR